jgi:hypothetical protein
MQLPKLAASRIGVVLFTSGLLCFAFLALLLPEQTSFKDYSGLEGLVWRHVVLRSEGKKTGGGTRPFSFQ